MRVGSKIGLGYLLIVGLMTAVLMILLSYLHQLHTIAGQLSEVSYPARQLQSELEQTVRRMEDLAGGLFRYRDLAVSYPQYQESVADYGRALDERLDYFQMLLVKVGELSLSSAEEREFEILAATWSQFQSRLKPALLNPAKAELNEKDIERGLLSLENGIEGLAAATGAVRERNRLQAQVTSDRARSIALGAVITAFLLTTLASLLVVRSLTARLQKLADGTRRIAGGDLSFRVDPRGGDELESLAVHFNAMARELAKVDQLKRDFISHVSHELKSPLASIEYATKILLKELAGPLTAKQVSLLSSNLECSQRLGFMISNLLDLSRIESGLMEYAFSETDLVSLTRAVLDELSPLAQERDCRVRMVASAESISFYCDQHRMMQVIRNLLDNALKFSGSEREIKVEISVCPSPPPDAPAGWRPPDGSNLVIWSVADRGPGIEDDEKHKVFEKFHQTPIGQRVAARGAGLGLAICRTIVQAHAGAIWVANHPGGGSVFSFAIPRLRPELQAPRSSSPVS